MKIKTICVVLMLILSFTLSACGNTQDSDNNYFENKQDTTINTSDNANANKNNDENGSENNNNEEVTSDKIGSLDGSAISGKIKGSYYADGNNIIVDADKLYLYDTQAGKVIASADISLKDLNVQVFSDGYFLVGRESSGGSGSFISGETATGFKGFILDKNFSLEQSISFGGLLNDDYALSITSIAISEDGKKIAIGGMKGLYIYNVTSEKVSTLLNFEENGRANDTQILIMDKLVFTQQDKTLVYSGEGATSGNSNGFSVYGTVSIDNSRLTITKNPSYKVDGMFKGGDMVVMPQTFDRNNGTLLMFDTVTNKERTIKFSSSSEGSDGVFCSNNGEHIATAVLNDNSLIVNIYNASSGELIHTEKLEDNNDVYFNRVPQILMLDGSNTCIVLLAQGIDDVTTLVKNFGFEG